jgi:hypothetical protein
MHGPSCEPTVRGDNLAQIDATTAEYKKEEAIVRAHIMNQWNERMCTTTLIQGTKFVTTYSLKKGLQVFGEKGKLATLKEMQQLHDRRCFQPIHRNTTYGEKKSAGVHNLPC